MWRDQKIISKQPQGLSNARQTAHGICNWITICYPERKNMQCLEIVFAPRAGVSIPAPGETNILQISGAFQTGYIVLQ